VVTGGSGGISAATWRLLASNSTTVAVNGRDQAKTTGSDHNLILGIARGQRLYINYRIDYCLQLAVFNYELSAARRAG
jgi:NAD(P)-dependent dehydrogenase (short-subunit alcohol dehydrogenase family)